MKKMRVLASLVSLMVLTVLVSSCLDGDEYVPRNQSWATVTGDRMLGFKLYADGGVILRPNAATIDYLDYFEKSERVYVVYAIQDGYQWPSEVTENTVVDIDLSSSKGCGWISLATKDVIDLHNNQAALDTLVTNTDSLYNLTGIWAYKGYLTMQTEVYYDNVHYPNFNIAFDSTKDIVADSLYLTFYHATNAEGNAIPADSENSYRLPENVYGKIEAKNDSIVLVVTSRVSNGGVSAKDVTKYCKIPKNHLFSPSW